MPDLPRVWWPSVPPNRNSGIITNAGPGSSELGRPEYLYYRKIVNGRGVEYLHGYKTAVDADRDENFIVLTQIIPGSVPYPS